jgi:hypothetical protein
MTRHRDKESAEQLARRALQRSADLARSGSATRDPDSPASPWPSALSLKGVRGMDVLGEDRLRLLREAYADHEIAFWNSVVADAITGGRYSQQARDLYLWLLYRKERTAIDARTLIVQHLGTSPEGAREAVELVEEVSNLGPLEVARLNAKYLGKHMRLHPDANVELLRELPREALEAFLAEAA